MGPIDPLPLIGTRLVCLGELLHIVGLITPNWLEATEGDEHVGLFNYCCGEGVCTVIYDPPITLKVTIVMTLLGTLCGQAGTAIAIFFIVSIYTSKPPHILVAVGGFLACIGAFNYTTIGVCVFGAKIYGEGLLIDTTSDVEFGFSFALCIVGAILMQTGGALAYLNVSRSKVVEKTLCPIA